MPRTTKSYAAATAKARLGPHTIERRDPHPHDVAIEILFCGVCHSDIHQARDEWGEATFPMVPGHEIVGRVTGIGAEVTRHEIGDLVGVGCFVDSCRDCAPCREGQEQFCYAGAAFTYNGTEMDRATPTYGGYSQRTVVDERYVVKVPAGMDAAAAAPLLCAGITMYSPLRQWQCKPGDKVAIVGLGGLGHMGVKIAAAMGAEVTVLSTSESKAKDARRLGAHDFVATKDPAVFEKLERRFDIVVDTVSANHDWNPLLASIRPRGTLVLVGAPPEPLPLSAFSLIGGNKRFVGSMIGGIAETQEMLVFCASKKIASDIEMIDAKDINEAYERMIKGDVRYRFVIDIGSLGER